MSKRSDEYSIAYTKWGIFSRDFRKHLAMKQSHFLGQVYVIFTKHFTQRVVERLSADEWSKLRRVLYHTVNTRICEILFWHYSNDPREVILQKDDLCVVITRSADGVSLVVRTFYKRSRLHCNEKYYYLKL